LPGGPANFLWCKNVYVTKSRRFAGQVCAGVDCKGAGILAVRCWARQQCLGGCGFDAPEADFSSMEFGWRRLNVRKTRGLIEFALALFQRVQRNRRDEIPIFLHLTPASLRE